MCMCCCHKCYSVSNVSGLNSLVLNTRTNNNVEGNKVDFQNNGLKMSCQTHTARLVDTIFISYKYILQPQSMCNFHCCRVRVRTAHSYRFKFNLNNNKTLIFHIYIYIIKQCVSYIYTFS